jgi:hypothetical protein
MMLKKVGVLRVIFLAGCQFPRICYNVGMTAFQTQTFVPIGGNLSITLPESLWETEVKLCISKEEKDEPIKMMSKEERLALLYPFGENFFADLPKLSEEEYIEKVRSLRGILTGPVDYSDLREETDREL